MKLDIAIKYVCSWLIFDVSTLKHFSVIAAISLAVAFKRRKVDYR